MADRRSKMTPDEAVQLVLEHGSFRRAAAAAGVDHATMYKWYYRAEQSQPPKPEDSTPAIEGRVKELETEARTPPSEGVRRYILTCAQNNTKVFKALWSNLQALADYYDAELLVSRFTYNLAAYGKGSVKPGTEAHQEDLWYAPEIAPYVVDRRVEIAPDLVWCGEMNILPTAVRPLSGFEVYNGRKSNVIPHVKVAMDSVPSGKHEPTKFNYSTGTVTMRNYVQKKAGLKAELHHCFSLDTEFLTDQGLRSFGDALGESVRVWSGEAWEEADIRSFGRQQLNEVVLVPAVYQECNGTPVFRAQNSHVAHRLKVTPDHTWHLADGTKTNALKKGDVVPAATVTTDDNGPEFEEGVRHGLIFGDGSVTYRSIKSGDFSHQVCIHGEAAARWAHLFENITRWASREHIENYHGTAYWKSPHNMKELPADNSSPAYLRGFFVGWIAADGYENERDNCTQLCSVTKYAIDWAVKMAPYAGFTVVGFCKGGADVTTFGKLREPIWRLTLSDGPRYWKVKSVRRKLGEHEVACAVVRPSHKFTLAGGILTGNCYGALLVEVDSDGDWFVRQLNADTQGTICDLDVKVKAGEVTTGNRVEAITWGDIHVAQIDSGTAEVAWGEGGLMDLLRPKYQFLHDLLDFRARNHHHRSDPHAQFRLHVHGSDSVEEELQDVAEFLRYCGRDYCKTVVVDSNHDNALERWLREADYRSDPRNALFFLEAQHRKYKAIAEGDEDFHLVEWVLRRFGCDGERFLREDESFIICKDKHGGIECGMHGHLGPNGKRGSINQFAKMGRKANIGHSHTAGIMDGVYQAGIIGKLDQRYNVGPSSWSHSNIVTYSNGKRAIITFWRGKCRAR